MADYPHNDPDKPNLVHALHPHNRGKYILLRVAPETIRIWAHWFGSEAKIGEYVGLVHGNFLGSVRGTTGLLKPTAIFKGLRRPLHHVTMNADHDVYIYVTNPEQNYCYPIRNRFGDSNVEFAEKPIQSVFTTFVSLLKDHIDATMGGMADKDSVDGVVLFWEWTEASAKDESVPYDSETRFDQRVL